ncbi:activating transcription factor 7-interacting protein 1-like isoform X1 [Leucoraja erinacea]|uniref:activating transcription factor 7-interacting protein 1-like isoform X1 n=1 Tax=Leucoraja erinaceus TaxID=7782 RepID=UPI002458812B|nr:activating transcription factor 7-interacting protein 1-like isoform X1 [Leucoraja erinacea]XP_055507722.1 activating transcription factor 7-interacting protein 1-like isoform X1 [Leucoraja erinacea]
MDAANIPPRKGFRAKKTLKVSDRQQWESLLRRKHHIEIEQPCKECNHQGNNLQSMNAGSIDGGKSNELFISKHEHNKPAESELNQSTTFNDNIKVIQTKFKILPDVCRTEKRLENQRLNSQKSFQITGHLETKTHLQMEHQNISLLKKIITTSSKTNNQNKTGAHSSAIHSSYFVLKEDFNGASKTNSTNAPELLDQKNNVNSISLDKTQNVDPVYRIVDVENLKYISSISNDRTSKLKKLKLSLVPMVENLSTESEENIMYNMQLSALPVTQKLKYKFNESLRSESLSSSVPKYNNEEKSDEFNIHTDDQDEITCTPIILKELKSPDRPRKKRTHSSEKKHKRKKIRTSHNVNSGHLNLSFDKSTETTKKITWDEMQKVLHRRIAAELSSDILGKKVEELTRRIENIDCTQKHEELAQSIQTRINNLEKKVTTVLQTINRPSARRKPEEPKMPPVPHYPTSAADLKNAEPTTCVNYMDLSAVPSDQKLQLLPHEKTSDSTNYELNLQQLKRKMPNDAKITKNIPLPKNLDTVTPASTHCSGVASKTVQWYMVSPNTQIWQSDSNHQQMQESILTSNKMIIDLTKGDEWCLNNQSRKEALNHRTSFFKSAPGTETATFKNIRCPPVSSC